VTEEMRAALPELRRPGEDVVTACRRYIDQKLAETGLAYDFDV
jgi:hypothetical protein